MLAKQTNLPGPIAFLPTSTGRFESAAGAGVCPDADEIRRRKNKESQARWRAKNPDYRKNHYHKNKARCDANHRKWVERNREALTRKRKEYYLQTREEHRVRAKEYHRVHAEANRRKAREWRINNPERAAATKAAYRKKNAQELSRKQMERYLKDPAKSRAANRARAERDREKLRAHAAQEALELTDSYVRNQLSKYTAFTTDSWTQEEVDAKRVKMIAAREKKVIQTENPEGRVRLSKKLAKSKSKFLQMMAAGEAIQNYANTKGADQ